MKRLDYEREIFGLLFQTSNGLQVYLDHLLKPDQLTAKQMFLMIVVSSFGEHCPTLKEVALKSNTSYQNVKQLALKLSHEGYLMISDDPNDRRKKTLSLTDKAITYWNDRSDQDLYKMEQLFDGYTDEELEAFMHFISKLHRNISKM